MPLKKIWPRTMLILYVDLLFKTISIPLFPSYVCEENEDQDANYQTKSYGFLFFTLTFHSKELKEQQKAGFIKK